MQKHCCHCTSIWENITCREMTVKKVSFKFLFKCRQCQWWRHCWRKTVPGFCRRKTERSITDCLKTCLWHSKIRWWRITQTLSTWKIGDRAQGVTQMGPIFGKFVCFRRWNSKPNKNHVVSSSSFRPNRRITAPECTGDARESIVHDVLLIQRTCVTRWLRQCHHRYKKGYNDSWRWHLKFSRNISPKEISQKLKQNVALLYKFNVTGFNWEVDRANIGC